MAQAFLKPRDYSHPKPTLEITGDITLLDQIVRDPSIYPLVSQDTDPPADEFTLRPLLDGRNVFVLVKAGLEPAGFWLFHCTSDGVYEAHTNLLDKWRGEFASEAALKVIELMFTRTPCSVLTTRVPAFNRATSIFARHHGFSKMYTEREAFLKDGVKNDVEFLYLTMSDWFFKQAGGYETAGARLVGAVGSAVYNRYVGVGLRLLRARDVTKADWFFNTIAPLIGRVPIRVLGTRGDIACLSVDGQVVQVSDDLEVVICQ